MQSIIVRDGCIITTFVASESVHASSRSDGDDDEFVRFVGRTRRAGIHLFAIVSRRHEVRTAVAVGGVGRVCVMRRGFSTTCVQNVRGVCPLPIFEFRDRLAGEG